MPQVLRQVTEMMESFLIILLTSFIVSVLVIFGLIKSPLAIKYADKPDMRKVHQHIVPRIGGLGLIISFLLVSIPSRILFDDSWTQRSQGCFLCLLLVTFFVLIIGTIDDVRFLGYKRKFVLQMMVALTVVFGFDIKLDEIQIFGMDAHLGLIGSIISVLWLIGVMNAINIIDGIDGLASIVGIIGFLTLTILANSHQATDIIIVSMICAGTISGFLIFNFRNENKCFLGDTGSLFIGSMLGVLSIVVTTLPTANFSIFVPLLVVGYPILDISVAMVRRYLRKNFKMKMSLKERFFKMFIADNEHLHHRMVYYGMSHVQSTFLLSMLAATLGSAAIIVSRNGPLIQMAVFVYMGISMILILNRLGYLGKKNWLHLPRRKSDPKHFVGVIQDDEVFSHSLLSFKQNKVKFNKVDWDFNSQTEKQYSAFIVHSSILGSFKENWKKALRLAEIKECPIFVIAERQEFKTIRPPPTGFKSIVPISKPARIPELINDLNRHIFKSHSIITKTEKAREQKVYAPSP